MEENKLFEKINDNPRKYMNIGLIISVLGLSFNLLGSFMLKEMLMDAFDKVGYYLSYALSLSTAFMVVLGIVMISNANTAMKNSKNIKGKKRNKKYK